MGSFAWSVQVRKSVSLARTGPIEGATDPAGRLVDRDKLDVLVKSSIGVFAAISPTGGGWGGLLSEYKVEKQAAVGLANGKWVLKLRGRNHVMAGSQVSWARVREE